MSDPKPTALGGRPSPEIFTSAAFDPPIVEPSRRLRVASVAMAIAAVLWLVVGGLALAAGESIDLLLMAFVGAAFDAFVALELWQQRWSKAILAYVIVRTLLAAIGFITLCVPAYLVALIAVPTRWPPAVPVDPDVPHAFRSRFRGGLYDAVPWLRQRQLTGSSQTGSRMCACGKPERDEVHDLTT